MKPLTALTIAICIAASAQEPRSMTLKEAVDLALQQNPDLVMARLDEQKAQLEVTAVAEPLLPRVVVGSGLAYSNGMPLSIEGSAPSILQANAVRSLYNAPQNYRKAQAREQARGASLGAEAMREEVALRTAILFLDLERVTRAEEFAERQLASLQRVEAAVRLRVEEGRALEIEGKRAAVNVARGRQKLQLLAGNRRAHSLGLARVLGLDSSQQISAALEQRPEPLLPESEGASVQRAIEDNKEIQRIESSIEARNLESKSFKALRLPRVDLVAQYALLGRYNNYEDFFQKFQRHNGQIGASIIIPLFGNPADEARAAQSLVEARRLQVELRNTRGRIEADTRGAWRRVREAETAREVARLDLDLAREQVGLLLAQAEEGRATQQQMEEARYIENERWMALDDARYALERARLEVLRQTNQLAASLQ